MSKHINIINEHESVVRSYVRNFPTVFTKAKKTSNVGRRWQRIY